MNYVNVVVLPRPHNVEFKCVGGLIFDINYVEPIIVVPFIGFGWRNSKERLHCENGPAVIRVDGAQCWCRYGEFHRENGPAVIWDDGTQFWWINGIKYSERDFNEEMRRRNELRKRSSLTKTT